MELFGDTEEPWLRTFLELPHGIPGHDTFPRPLAALDPQHFLDAFMRWTQSLRTTLADDVVAIDGKALRRAIAAGQSPKIVVSAWAAVNGLVLGQRRVDDKNNESSAARWPLHFSPNHKRQTRCYWQSTNIDWFADREKWECVTRTASFLFR